MRMTKIAALLLLSVALTACKTNTKPLPPPSVAPTVMCSEHAPDERLPPLPAAPAGRLHRPALEHLVKALYGWSATAAGVVHRQHIKRHTTARCLDRLRARGIIN